MKTATAEKANQVTLDVTARPRLGSIFKFGPGLVLAAGTVVDRDDRTFAFDVDTPVSLPALDAGADYFIHLNDGKPEAFLAQSSDLNDVLGGFHFAPGGNAPARSGGDDTPAINPWSVWDIGFRPVCADPRGMTYIADAAKPFWCDIYLLCADVFREGCSSLYGEIIADGDDTPARDDDGVYEDLNYATATEIFGKLGKTLLSVEDFFAAAYGVTEATSIGKDPKKTGLDAPRTSKWGVMQATGNLHIWGHDGDPDGPRRACIFGGNWGDGGWAGSRCALVGRWPGLSYGWIGARGRSDHLSPG